MLRDESGSEKRALFVLCSLFRPTLCAALFLLVDEGGSGWDPIRWITGSLSRAALEDGAAYTRARVQ